LLDISLEEEDSKKSSEVLEEEDSKKSSEVN
jgi:hypothetical protein